jgi:hypothetical protein
VLVFGTASRGLLVPKITKTGIISSALVIQASWLVIQASYEGQLTVNISSI